MFRPKRQLCQPLSTWGTVIPDAARSTEKVVERIRTYRFFRFCAMVRLFRRQQFRKAGGVSALSRRTALSAISIWDASPPPNSAPAFSEWMRLAHTPLAHDRRYGLPSPAPVRTGRLLPTDNTAGHRFARSMRTCRSRAWLFCR